MLNKAGDPEGPDRSAALGRSMQPWRLRGDAASYATRMKGGSGGVPSGIRRDSRLLIWQPVRRGRHASGRSALQALDAQRARTNRSKASCGDGRRCGLPFTWGWVKKPSSFVPGRRWSGGVQTGRAGNQPTLTRQAPLTARLLGQVVAGWHSLFLAERLERHNSAGGVIERIHPLGSGSRPFFSIASISFSPPSVWRLLQTARPPP